MDGKKAELFRCGKELFATRGFKDTNIADITKMAGVSVGTFYNYYPSKEKLFMEIFLEENVKLKRRMMESVDLTGTPIDIVKRMLALNMEGIKGDPILRQWYNRDVFAKIERLYREENGAGAIDFLYGDTVRAIDMWQAEGKMRKDIPGDMIMALFMAIINIDLHKDEIGLQYFPQVQDYLTEFVMKGLMDVDR
jgi:AcrR family transcriptional regulator